MKTILLTAASALGLAAVPAPAVAQEAHHHMPGMAMPATPAPSQPAEQPAAHSQDPATSPAAPMMMPMDHTGMERRRHRMGAVGEGRPASHGKEGDGDMGDAAAQDAIERRAHVADQK